MHAPAAERRSLVDWLISEPVVLPVIVLKAIVLFLDGLELTRFRLFRIRSKDRTDQPFATSNDGLDQTSGFDGFCALRQVWKLPLTAFVLGCSCPDAFSSTESACW